MVGYNFSNDIFCYLERKGMAPGKIFSTYQEIGRDPELKKDFNFRSALIDYGIKKKVTSDA